MPQNSSNTPEDPSSRPDITATSGIPKVTPATVTAEQAEDSASGTGTAPEAEVDASERTSRRPALPRFLAVTLGVAAVAISLYFIRGLQDIIGPMFLGLNLVIVAYPIQRVLSRVMHRYLAAAVALVAILAVLTVFIWACVWALLELLNALPQYNREFLQLWSGISETAAQLGIDSRVMQNALGAIQPKDVMSLVMPIISNASSILTLMLTLITSVFFLAMDSASMANRLKLLPLVNPRALVVVTDFSHGVRRYWLTTTVFGAIVAAADVAALSIIGVPLVWAWGVLSFVTNYIPNIGFVIGLVPPALLALLSGGWVPALVVVIVYCLLNFVIQVLIQPKFVGESVGVTATISFLSLLFWVAILGGFGALLALPATLLVKALLVDSDSKARWMNIFLASSPDTALPDDERPEPRSPKLRRAENRRRALLRG